MEWLVALLIPFLGHDDYHTREAADAAIMWMANTFETVGPLKNAASEAGDPEIRRRCDDILCRYYYLPVPDRVWMSCFDESYAPKEFVEANQLFPGYDVRDYIRRLIARGDSKNAIQQQIKKAETRAFFARTAAQVNGFVNGIIIWWYGYVEDFPGG